MRKGPPTAAAAAAARHHHRLLSWSSRDPWTVTVMPMTLIRST